MLIRDMDGDGKNDIIWGVGHGFGLYWWQQEALGTDGKTSWKKHLIDDTFSQPHCLEWADLNGDGKDELITGKRVRAHNGKDPGGKMPPCIFYYTWNKKTLKFKKHIIEKGTVGVGLQIRTGDLNGDGKIDIAVAGKKRNIHLVQSRQVSILNAQPCGQRVGNVPCVGRCHNG